MFSIRLAVSADIDAIFRFDQVAQQEERRRAFIIRSVDTRTCSVIVEDEQVVGYAVLDYSFFEQGFISVFQQALEALPFSPDLILLFAGCDSHKDDCGGGITNWTKPEFEVLTRSVLDLARRAGCPVLSVQGGGYKLPVTVATTLRHVEVLAQTD